MAHKAYLLRDYRARHLHRFYAVDPDICVVKYVFRRSAAKKKNKFQGENQQKGINFPRWLAVDQVH